MSSEVGMRLESDAATTATRDLAHLSSVTQKGELSTRGLCREQSPDANTREEEAAVVSVFTH